MPQASTGRERLQDALLVLSRSAARHRPKPEHRAPAPRPRVAAQAANVPSPEQTSAASAPQLAAPADLLERLDRIESKISDLGRHEVASGERFREWLSGGYWAHIRFGEFLKLRRAGIL